MRFWNAILEYSRNETNKLPGWSKGNAKMMINVYQWEIKITRVFSRIIWLQIIYKMLIKINKNIEKSGMW